MKRTVGIVAGLAALGVVAYVGTQLWAQQPGGATQAAAPAQTRIAVMNLMQVIKNYNKAKFYETELDETLKPFRAQGEKLKKSLTDWQAYLTKPDANLTPEKRDEGERNVTNAKRQLEDLDKEARKAFGKKREQQVVQLYREIEDAVKRYASSNGFHLVLSYGEPANPSDLFSAPNIARKLEGLQMGACSPMYMAEGMDISVAVTDALNRAYPGTGTPVGTATPAAGTH